MNFKAKAIAALRVCSLHPCWQNKKSDYGRLIVLAGDCDNDEDYRAVLARAWAASNSNVRLYPCSIVAYPGERPWHEGTLRLVLESFGHVRKRGFDVLVEVSIRAGETLDGRLGAAAGLVDQLFVVRGRTGAVECLINRYGPTGRYQI